MGLMRRYAERFTPDQLQKVTAKKAGELRDGEEYLGAVFGAPRGDVIKGVGGLAGGLIGMGVAAQHVKKSDDFDSGDESGIAGQIPDKRVVMAFTAQRFLVFSFHHRKQTAGELLLEMPLSDVARISMEGHRGHDVVTMGFSDGSERNFDMVVGTKPGPFIESFDLARGQRP